MSVLEKRSVKMIAMLTGSATMPSRGAMKRLAGRAMIDNRLKYNEMRGSVPRMAPVEAAMNKKMLWAALWKKSLMLDGPSELICGSSAESFGVMKSMAATAEKDS